MRFIQRWAPELLSILRIVSAGSFFTHGTMKLFAWPAPFEYPMNAMLYVAGILEVIGGVLLLAGLFTRPIAFLLSGLMAFAYFIAHASQGFFPVLNHGEAAMLYCFVFLYIAAAGPGSLSIDALAGKAQQPMGAGSS
ncbi:DoxX family protein [Chelativorans salis]|uniref:DoxX family protein n=1 Tax=Chelativorans salis TaxID=2978478 RepID=A0ABT2LK85_9HYPH|nr:DoxX family protein [Chelativorans sp. EGI FJ00035]MCT7374083.1 DoxX family protein [Chelativorans sp. EGI FJ00035]